MRRVVAALLLAECARGCTAVATGRILGADLARADSRFSPIPPDFDAGFAPVPGSQRLLDARQLIATARRFRIPVENPSPLCFERATSVLTGETLRAALERVLWSGTRLEIADFSRHPVPDGEIVFSLAELPRPRASEPDGAVVWRGRLKYGANNSVAIWALVHISKFEQWIEAAAPVAARQVLRPEQVAVKSGRRFPFGTAPVSNLAMAIGMKTMRSLAAGQIVMPAMLAAPNDIERGDMVDVEISSGAVSLKFAARAETGGHRGEVVLVSSDANKRRYRGHVQDKGKVVIHADSNTTRMAGDRPGGFGATRARGGGSQGEKEESGAGTDLGARSLPE